MSELPPIGGRGPGGERLIAGLILLERAGDFIPVDEALVERALDPLWLPKLNDRIDVNSGLTALLRTAAYFILDESQVAEALESEPPEGIPSFPPLPFRRVWIETHRQRQGRDLPTTYMRYKRAAYEYQGIEMPEETVEILGVGLVEVVQRREWDVYVPYRIKRADSMETDVQVGAYRITPSEIVMPKLEYVRAETALRALLTMAINGAHLITARNVPHREVVLPRAQRRGMERGWRFPPRIPKLYYVDLAESGEGEEPVPTHREYHCRWLVRGHWRHLPSGDELCTCYGHRHNPLPATYIDPYVKGPVGAPWKGRPVHRGLAVAS